MNRLTLPLAALCAILLVVLVAGFTGRHSVAVPTSGAVALERNFVSVYRNVAPSVVQIRSSEGLGSGIVFDRSGNIVTNYHVVSGSTSFTVTTASGKQLPARLVGEFAPDDLAVIRVNATNL